MLKIFIIILIIYIILTIFYEKEHIQYGISKYIFYKETSSLPLPFFIKNIILKYIKQIDNYQTYSFIDFGCGYGDVINTVKPLFNKIIGIELEKHPAEYCIERFRNDKNIQIHNMDIINYIFTDEPTILYMYEPLWLLNKDDALIIYKQVFQKLININKKIYIIYCSATKIQNIQPNTFEEFGFTKVYYKKIYRGFYIPFLYNNLYIYKKN